MSFTYKRTEPSLWTVGEYLDNGRFEPESDHGSPQEAAQRVAWLNGGGGPEPGTEQAPGEVPTFYGEAATWLGLADNWRDGEDAAIAAAIAQGYALLAVAEAINKTAGRGIES